MPKAPGGSNVNVVKTQCSKNGGSMHSEDVSTLPGASNFPFSRGAALANPGSQAAGQSVATTDGVNIRLVHAEVNSK